MSKWMQMRQAVPPRSELSKVILVFLFGGALGAVLVAFIITRPTLKHVFFATREWSLLPLPSYWALTSCAFVFGLTSSYIFSTFRNWLTIRVSRYQAFGAIAVATAMPL